MPNTVKVDHVRDNFITAAESATTLYDRVRLVGSIKSSSSIPRLHNDHVRRVIELAFMGLVSSWEDFLERSLVRYMAGALTKTGYQPFLRIGPAKSIEHAYQILTADPKHDPARNIISWNDPASVANRAKLYFQAGRPYAPVLTTHCSLMQDATKIRNRVAHSSEKCREDFKIVARKFKGLAKGAKLPKGYRAGYLLLAKADRQFGNRVKNKGWTIFQAYCELYKDSVNAIVPE